MDTQIYVRGSNEKFDENPLRGSQVVACGQADGDQVSRCFLKLFVVK
jgi:hypothetical protein